MQVNNQFCLLIETSGSRGFLGLYCLTKKGEDNIIIKQWDGFPSRFITSAFEYEVYQKLSYLVLDIGPGRFTGVRVGVSFAKTLSYILDIPIYPISSLKILAASQSKQSKAILVLINAFQNSLYMALYQKKGLGLEELISPCVILPEELNKKKLPECVCVGDGYKVYESFWSPEFKKKIQITEDVFPEVKNMTSLLNTEFNSSHLKGWKNINPLYLSSPVRIIK